jgi:ATP-dependent Clp protease protease subunit
MAAILFAAGTQRDILPHGRVMIHDPLISDGVGGSALQVQDISNRLLASRKELCTILAQCTGKSLRQIYRKTGKDTFFDAKGAVAFGLADSIIHKI